MPSPHSCTSRHASVLALPLLLSCAWHQIQPRRPPLSVHNWSNLDAIPEGPALLRHSPAQEWLDVSGGIWTIKSIQERAESSRDGEYRVVLMSRQADPRFLYHVNTTILDSPVISEPNHDRIDTSLREALLHVWGDRGTRGSHFYLSASLDDFPVSLAEPVFEFLPSNCVCDDSFAHLYGEVDGIACHHAPCRGLTSRIWLGAEGVSTAAHYDVSHNLFLQADGKKTFILVPPEAHRTMKLHPAWHGSRRQSQIHLPDLVLTPTTSLPALGPVHRVAARLHSWLMGDSWTDLATQVTLQKGDLLYVPPMWFHYVCSDTASVGVNFWTPSLNSDIWDRLIEDKSAHESWISSTCGAASQRDLLKCVLHSLSWLLAFVAREPEPNGRGLLTKRALSLIGTRYVSRRQGQVHRHLESLCLSTVRDISRHVDRPSESNPPASKYEHEKLRDALLALSEAARDLMLDEFVERAGVWSVKQLGLAESDGTAVHQVLASCFAEFGQL